MTASRRGRPRWQHIDAARQKIKYIDQLTLVLGLLDEEDTIMSQDDRKTYL